MVLQVLRLPAVGSKRFLTTKVDRCVTGAPLPLYILLSSSSVACTFGIPARYGEGYHDSCNVIAFTHSYCDRCTYHSLVELLCIESLPAMPGSIMVWSWPSAYALCVSLVSTKCMAGDRS